MTFKSRKKKYVKIMVTGWNLMQGLVKNNCYKKSLVRNFWKKYVIEKFHSTRTIKLCSSYTIINLTILVIN